MKTVEGKVPYELIPVESMEQFARAMEAGAKEYKPNDWREGQGMPWSWLIAAALRHSWKLLWGEDIDPKSGLHHGAHLMCCGAMLVYFYTYRHRYTKDDRFKAHSLAVAGSKPPAPGCVQHGCYKVNDGSKSIHVDCAARGCQVTNQ